MVLCMQNSAFRTRITSLCGSQVSPVDSCNRNSVLTTRIASLYCPRPHLRIFANKTACHTSPYGSQTSPVDLRMQNSVFSTRITSLYGSQTSPVDLCMKTACLPQEFLVFTGPRPRLGICECKTTCLAPE